MHTSNIHTHTHTNTRTQVFVPFELKSGLPPRRVALERKRRRYQAYDIEHLLLERKLDYSKMEMDGKPLESDLDLMDLQHDSISGEQWYWWWCWSTNFVMWVELPGGKKDIKNNLGLSDQEYWIKAGVAMFCSLRY